MTPAAMMTVILTRMGEEGYIGEALAVAAEGSGGQEVPEGTLATKTTKTILKRENEDPPAQTVTTTLRIGGTSVQLDGEHPRIGSRGREIAPAGARLLLRGEVSAAKEDVPDRRHRTEGVMMVVLALALVDHQDTAVGATGRAGSRNRLTAVQTRRSRTKVLPAGKERERGTASWENMGTAGA